MMVVVIVKIRLWECKKFCWDYYNGDGGDDLSAGGGYDGNGDWWYW